MLKAGNMKWMKREQCRILVKAFTCSKSTFEESSSFSQKDSTRRHKSVVI